MAAARQALEAIVTVIVGLLLALVADGAGDTPTLAAAEGRSVAVCVVRTRRTYLIHELSNVGLCDRRNIRV